MELKLEINFARFPVFSTFNRTLWNWNLSDEQLDEVISRLLIVPYGIETKSCVINPTYLSLLIVPYGIETLIAKAWSPTWSTFNRTLWNWNLIDRIETENKMPFNRTLWNWNYLTLQKVPWNTVLLIVPYGIETGNHIRDRSKHIHF